MGIVYQALKHPNAVAVRDPAKIMFVRDRRTKKWLALMSTDTYLDDGVPTFVNYAIADGLYNLLFPDKTGIKIIPKTKYPDFQLCFSFWDEAG